MLLASMATVTTIVSAIIHNCFLVHKMKNSPKYILQFTTNRRHPEFFLCSLARSLNLMIGELDRFCNILFQAWLQYLTSPPQKKNTNKKTTFLSNVKTFRNATIHSYAYNYY